MKVRVKDIAKAAGVSPSTVSLVLNNRPSRIAEDTREHILGIAREMQLKMESGVDFTAFERVKSFGIILPDSMNPFFHKLGEEITNQGFLRGYMVLACHVRDDIDRFYMALKGLMAKNVDGLIVIPPRAMDKENVKLLKSFPKSGIPMTLLDRAAFGVFCDFVTADNKYGGRIAAEYLIRHGHKRIGCMVGGANIYTSRTRVAGYKEALAEAGLPFEKELVYYGNYDMDTGRTGIERLLDKGITAVVAGNDLMACGVYAYAEEKHLSIPEDISVVGYDNTERCGLLKPPLTSVEQNVDLMAAKAVEVLVSRMEESPDEDEEPARNYYFTPYVVERGSVAKMEG